MSYRLIEKLLQDDVDEKFLIVFSPSGKLVQIEYALAAVAAGAPSVGIKGLFDCS